jgi:hypothetical protein
VNKRKPCWNWTPVPLEGDLLQTLHLALKKIDIHLKPFTRNFPLGPEGMGKPLSWEGQRAIEDYPIQ